MKLIIAIDTDNAAFGDHPLGPMGEVARILHALATRLEYDSVMNPGGGIHYQPLTLHDLNGNAVGTAGFASQLGEP